ncbi:TIGR00730 family Rossman fold protein [Algihabitans albus]|uniref:LOG family protein n=1 Tax=Algihabitans albus TaxID=2164067 RepID=UPI0035D07590
MTEPYTLCLYCGSSNRAEPIFYEAAAEFGRETARRGWRLVYGGGRVGLMGAAADGALEAGGEVIGIIPGFLHDFEVGHHGVTRLEVVESMHIRKMRMFELSDAFCILPGGLGTLDETFEIMTWRQLGLHEKPIVLANLKDFWTPFLDLLNAQVEAKLVRPEHAALLQTADSIPELFDALGKRTEAVAGATSKFL